MQTIINDALLGGAVVSTFAATVLAFYLWGTEIFVTLLIASSLAAVFMLLALIGTAARRVLGW